MPDILLIPTRVDAFWLDAGRVVGAATDFSRLPYTTPTGDANPDVANLSEDVVNPPFDDQTLVLKAGVHLHWSLPWGLTTQRGGLFPNVPDRWLVVRRRPGSTPEVEAAWVVESNYAYPDGEGADSGAVAFPLPAGHPLRRTRPFRYLGRKVPLAAWTTRDPGAEYFDGLTAAGHGDPTYASYYPNCLSTLGLHDDIGRGELNGVGYDVYGWYADPHQDALAQFVADFRSSGSTGDVAAAVAEALGWALPADDRGPVLDTLLCVGRVVFQVAASGPVPESPAFAAADPTVVLASTGTEALSAYLAPRVAAGDAAAVEDQLEALQMAKVLGARQLDVGAKLAEGRHTKGFVAAGGGALWAVRSESTPGTAAAAASTDVPELPAGVAALLDAVNAAQQASDRARDDLTGRRREVFADWYRYMVCAHPPDDGRDDYPDTDEVRHFIETRGLAPLTAATTAAATLAAALTAAVNELQAALDAINTTLPPRTRYVARKRPAPRFWSPREPVVLLAGPAALAVAARAGTAPVPCRRGHGMPFDDRLADRLPDFTALLDAAGDAAVNSWTAQPWAPTLLQWEAEVLPAAGGNNLGAPAGEYDAAFVTANFALPADAPDLAPRPGRGGLSKAADVYAGTSLLTAGAARHLGDLLDAYLADPHADPHADLFRRFTTAKQLLADPGVGFLSQALGGFNEALLMRKQTRQVETADPLAFDDELAFAAAVAAAVGTEGRSAPQPEWDFNPIVAGGLRLLRLRLLDRFGRSKDVDCSAVETTARRGAADGAGLIALPPRVVQPTRLNLRWLAAGAGPSPVCGWLLPNNLDGSLMVYAAAGTALGYVDADARWQSMPGAPASSPDAIADPCLRGVVKTLLAQGADDLTRFLTAVEGALEQIDPEAFAQHPDLALLMGRPVAVARVSVGLELQGRPAAHQGWNHFRTDLGRTDRASTNFTRVAFPIRLGEGTQFNDGLVGYWLDAAPTFYSPWTALPAGDIQPSAGDAAPITRALDDPPLTVTVLLDPRGVLHACSGIQPTKAIGIPPAQYAAALSALEVVFLAAPVLTGVGAVELPLPVEPGYVWSWADPSVPLRPVDAKAVFARPQELREGWVVLRPAPVPPPPAPS